MRFKRGRRGFPLGASLLHAGPTAAGLLMAHCLAPDTTFGLRTGPRGLLIGFAVGHLGLRVGVNGTLLLHRQPVAADAATMDVGLPDEVAKRWPAELKGVRLGGVRVGARRADVACNVTSFTTPGALALRCEFEWGTPSSPMH